VDLGQQVVHLLRRGRYHQPACRSPRRAAGRIARRGRPWLSPSQRAAIGPPAGHSETSHCVGRGILLQSRIPLGHPPAGCVGTLRPAP
jgi:hypothetical protein